MEADLWLLRGVIEADHDSLAERLQRSLNPLGLRIVLWVQHSPHHRLANAESSCQIRVSKSALSHCQVKRQLGCRYSGTLTGY